MRRSPSLPLALALIGLISFACPTPKSGDDRLIPDSGTSEDSGSNLPDSGDSSDSGPMSFDSGTDAGPPPPDSGMKEDAGDPNCVPTGPEDCSNGIDDDCQNGIDCNDPACGTCVPVPENFSMGVMVPSNEPCPAGFTADETSLYAGLDPGAGCQGNCTCTPNETRCLGELFIYSTQQQCTADVNLTGGQRYAGLIDESCTMEPVAQGFPGGFRIGNWTVEQSCNASGVASPSPYSWQETMKFCVAQVGLQGCDANSVCFPAEQNACAITPGGAACPDPFTERMAQWYTGVSDTRSCGPCDCTAQGGSCQFARIALGSDWSCTDAYEISQQNPTVCMSNYSPPARVIGSPQPPTCTPTSQQSGTIEPTGQQTVCCMP